MNNLDEVRIIELKIHGDERGRLIVAESMTDIPLVTKRVFFIYGSKGDIVRGVHANRHSAFVLICVSGNCRVRIRDGFGNGMEYALDKPNRALFLPPMIWKEMFDFSPDAVLLVLSDCLYDKNEYIRDFAVFTQEYSKLVSLDDESNDPKE